MTWAELRDLIDGLPQESATKSALAGDVEGKRWSQDTYIGAAQYNVSLLMIRVLWAAHLKGSAPEMELMDPPRLEQDDRLAEAAAALDARNRAVLDRLRPQPVDEDPAVRQEWLDKIRELEQSQPAT
ncbi:hypothetical protein [Streptomyces sp. H27-D2]|uniref:hypothetical protein n=1 Tax=Streptomyces sp. H27-D2 TaxID=3046304 RepID=UPI002DB9C484|nr:hypothetical protein [Streptomyces sp. H27-D2]MEC4016101.1 hypothetical protein [Streptomyces sp. H27-D2]